MEAGVTKLEAWSRQELRERGLSILDGISGQATAKASKAGGQKRVLWRLATLCTAVLLLAGIFARHHVRAAEAARERAHELAAAPVPRAFYGRRLEPRTPVVLQGGGAIEEASFGDYSAALEPSPPMLASSAVDLQDDLPAFFARLRDQLQTGQPAVKHGLLIPQISLSLHAGNAAGHSEGRVGSAKADNKLRELVSGLRSLDRPVFLRLGYDCNDPHTGYQPAEYIAEFRQIARQIRAAGLEQVALVWDWSPDAELDLEEAGARERDASARWLAFYPGDDAVDWWGVELFSEPGINSPVTARFLDEAAQRRFPVMIGESTPKGHDTSEGDLVMDAWFRPYFNLIAKSPMIKAFCYFDRDWRAYPQWTTWGDARVEAAPQVLQYVRGELASPLYARLQERGSTESLLGVRERLSRQK